MFLGVEVEGRFGERHRGAFWGRYRGVVFQSGRRGVVWGQNRVVGVSRIGLWRRRLQKTRVLGSRRLYNRSEEFLCRVIAPAPKPLSERKFSRGLKMTVLRVVFGVPRGGGFGGSSGGNFGGYFGGYFGAQKSPR